MALANTNNQQENSADCYLDLRRLSERCCMSVRSLRDDLKDPTHPLPHFLKGGKIYVSWPEFKIWMEDRFRVKKPDLQQKIDEAVSDLFKRR